MPDSGQANRVRDGLRSFIDSCDEAGELKRIDGAHWDLEIGTLTEAVAEHIPSPPAILFDNIPSYAPGYRVLSLPFATARRTALALGMSADTGTHIMARETGQRLRDAPAVPPNVVPDGPVMENRMTGADINLERFPVLRAHEKDGGRYIGTGDTVVNRDPDSGYVNMGTYRIQLHGPDNLGLWISPGKQGRLICQKYWDRGEAAPIAATFGGDLLVFMMSYARSPWGVEELARVGGFRGSPVDVINGPLTGLPIPADAEIAIEGEVPPPSEQSAPEGPFGEWPGYYSGGTIGTGENQPVINVKAVYYRNNPILLNMAPQWPGAPYHSVKFTAGMLWDQLEAAGVPGITGVHIYHQFLCVVSIKQAYAGHAKQTGAATIGCAANAYLGRYVVVVDEDIDPANIQEVLWAMETRVDPASDIDIVKNAWAGPLDPRMPPDQKAAGNFTNARAIFHAVRPYHWKDTFPMVNRAPRAAIHAAMEKYRDKLDFPSMGNS